MDGVDYQDPSVTSCTLYLISALSEAKQMHFLKTKNPNFQPT